MRVVVDGVTLADSRRAIRVLETSHPPAWYIPPQDVRMDLLEPSRKRTVCEFKGDASYFTIRAGGSERTDAAWTYVRPLPGYEAIEGHVAFYAGRVDEAWVDDARAEPQPGDFYGGWVTPGIVGPFKGGPGSLGW